MNTDIYVTGAGGSRGTPCARGPLARTVMETAESRRHTLCAGATEATLVI